METDPSRMRERFVDLLNVTLRAPGEVTENPWSFTLNRSVWTLGVASAASSPT